MLGGVTVAQWQYFCLPCRRPVLDSWCVLMTKRKKKKRKISMLITLKQNETNVLKHIKLAA